MDMATWIITALALLLGCWVQATMGFGMAVVLAPILVVIKPEWVPFLITFLALYLTLINTWSERDAINMKGITIPLLTRVAGTVAGAWLLSHLSILWIQILVSVSALLAVVLSMVGKRFEATPVRMGWAGFFSGLMSTTTSIGGIPMAIVMQHGEPRSVRANVSLFFSIGCLMSIASYVVIGRLSVQVVLDSLILSPMVFLGHYWGRHTRKHVDKGRFRMILLVLCSLAALFALFGTLREFML